MRITIIATLGSLLCVASTFRVATADEPGHEGLTQEIAACMLLGNQEEVALAQFAEQHADHAQVKEFAKALVAAHTNAIATIKKAAPEVAELQLSANKDGTAAHQHQALALLQQIKSECLALTEKELSEYKGNEFDQAFLGQQIGAHIGMLAHLRASKAYASPELQKVISEGEKTAEAHIAEAKKLMSQLRTNASTTARVGQRPAARTR